MKKYIKVALRGLLIVPALAFAFSAASTAVVPADVFAGSPLSEGAQRAQGQGTANNIDGNAGIFRTITNILLFLIGAVAVIMLVIGGFRYVISGGDQSQVTSAKNTILYAIIGIIVAFLSYAAVNFVLTRL